MLSDAMKAPERMPNTAFVCLIKCAVFAILLAQSAKADSRPIPVVSLNDFRITVAFMRHFMKAASSERMTYTA
jgi:hypothetical protein